MSTTPNMQLIVPEVLVTTGPTYATQVNAALDVVDAHDHSSGKGVRVTPSGLNINGDLPFNSNQATGLKGVVLTDQSTTLYVTPAALFRSGADLYYRDSAGNLVRITASGALNLSSVGAITSLASPAAATYVSASKKFVWSATGTEYATMESGDLKVYSTASGAGNAVTIKADSSTSAYDLKLPTAAPTDNQYMRMKSATAAEFVSLLGTTNQVTITQNAADTTLSLPQDIHSAATPTFGGMTLTGLLSGAAISGTTGTFSGAVSGTTGTFSGAVSGTTGTFSGNMSLTGGGGSTISGANYAATLDSVTTDNIYPRTGTDTFVNGNLAIVSPKVLKTNNISSYLGGVITVSDQTTFSNTIKTATINELGSTNGVQIQGRTSGSAFSSSYVGYVTTFTAGSDQAISAVPGEYDIIFFLVPAGEWEITGHTILHIDPSNAFSGNNTANIVLINSAISTTSLTFDSQSAINSVGLSNTATITGSLGKVYIPTMKRRVRVSSSTTYYLVTQLIKPVGSGAAGSKFLAASSVKLERVG